jgi:hypothetical protein
LVPLSGFFDSGKGKLQILVIRHRMSEALEGFEHIGGCIDHMLSDLSVSVEWYHFDFSISF